MDLKLIQSFYVTPSARGVLGEECLNGAFDWQRASPDLRRLTFGPLDPERLDSWRLACFEACAEPLLVLGPDDRTPDLNEHPTLVGINVLSAHEADSADMHALRFILHEPDEVFTRFWDDYAGGYRAWFVPPGPVGADGEAFWPGYRNALNDYTGPVLGMPGPEFVAAVRKAWRCALQRRDLSQRGCKHGRLVRFALRRFPFCALNFDTESRAWSIDGWLPEDLDRVDPGAGLRSACEKEVDEGLTVGVAPERGSAAKLPASDAVEAWSKIAVAEFLAKVESKVLLDRVLSSLESPGLTAPDARGVAMLRDQRTSGGQRAGTEAAGGEPAVIWSRVTWNPGTKTLFVTWARDYIARDRLWPDGVVLASVEVDGKWHDLEARFATWQDGSFNFGQVKFDIPSALLATILAGRLELRVAPDREGGKDRLVVLFRPGASGETGE